MAAATREPAARNLAIAVRRARPSDTDAVLAFASTTFDGWDYIPEVWADWLVAPDGVLLVATAQDDERPIAVTRVTVLSRDEGWLEGIRVDPAVRGRGVATNLQIAELAWAQAHRLRVLRYLTGHANTGSIKLGAHHGFAPVGDRRYHGRTEEGLDGPGDRPATLDALQATGALLDRHADEGAVAAAWAAIDADPTFSAGGRLYECRPWALQRLDRERFDAHVRAGEVLIDRGPRGAAGVGRSDGQAGRGEPAAVAIMPRMAALAEDDSPHFALLAGDGHAALRLAVTGERAAGQSIAVRMPDPAPMFDDPTVVAAWAAAGLEPRAWTQLVLERWLEPGEVLPIPEPPDALDLRERPVAVAVAPTIGEDAGA